MQFKLRKLNWVEKKFDFGLSMPGERIPIFLSEGGGAVFWVELRSTNNFIGDTNEDKKGQAFETTKFPIFTKGDYHFTGPPENFL